MKYAIISDIHSDYKALLEVLKHIKEQNVEKIVCLGDIVGYGKEPEDVVQEIIKQNIICVCGNHEKALFDNCAFEFMNDKAKKAIDENHDELSDNSLTFLEQLPEYHTENNMRFVHGMPPNSIFEYFHLTSKEDILKKINLYKEHITFCGHSHRTGIIKIKNKSLFRNVFSKFNKMYKLETDIKYIINVGSISLSRDDNIKGWTYVIYDRNTQNLEFKKA